MKLFLLLAVFGLCSCLPAKPPIQARRIGAFQRPDCSNGRTAAELDLERKKQDLFRAIETSVKYSSAKKRDDALRAYKKQLALKEQFVCPEDVARWMKSIAEQH